VLSCLKSSLKSGTVNGPFALIDSRISILRTERTPFHIARSASEGAEVREDAVRLFFARDDVLAIEDISSF